MATSRWNEEYTAVYWIVVVLVAALAALRVAAQSAAKDLCFTEIGGPKLVFRKFKVPNKVGQATPVYGL